MILLPRAGLDHPLFHHIAKTDFLELRARFDAPLRTLQVNAIRLELCRFLSTYPWHRVGAETAWFMLGRCRPGSYRAMVSPTAVVVRFHGVDNAAPLAALAQLLADMALLAELTFNVLEPDYAGRPGDRRVDPRSGAEETVDDLDTYFERSFDESAPRLPTERPSGLYAIAPPTTLAERRVVPFFEPGFRVSYGLCDVQFGPASRRAAVVAASMLASIDDAFGGMPPTMSDLSGAPKRVTPIVRRGRRGYSFVVKRDEMMVRYPDGYRYQEDELLYATCDVCDALGLARTIHWQRDVNYVINVWEPAQALAA